MEIRLGADAMGRGGKLGEVKRVVLTPRSDHIVDLVIQQAGLLAPERVVPLTFVSGVEDGVVRLDLDGAGFKAMVEYSADAYRAHDKHYIAPPAVAYQGDAPIDYQMDRLTAEGSYGYLSGKPFGYPGGEVTESEDRKPPIISHGTDVFDLDGKKVGEVGEFGVDATDGHPTYITIRHGMLFKDETELPTDVIRDLHHTGVLLGISGRELDRYTRHQSDAAA